MATSQSPTDQAPVYPCGCCPERLDYCPEWWRLSEQYAAAFDCYSHGGMTWDDMGRRRGRSAPAVGLPIGRATTGHRPNGSTSSAGSPGVSAFLDLDSC